MDLNYELLDKISDNICEYVTHSSILNTPINNIQCFYIEDTKVAITYTSILNAYDFMVIRGKIDSLEVFIDNEPCLNIEEKYITDKVNNYLLT